MTGATASCTLITHPRVSFYLCRRLASTSSNTIFNNEGENSNLKSFPCLVYLSSIFAGVSNDAPGSSNDCLFSVFFSNEMEVFFMEEINCREVLARWVVWREIKRFLWELRYCTKKCDCIQNLNYILAFTVLKGVVSISRWTATV